jgi:hypothetical protein
MLPTLLDGQLHLWMVHQGLLHVLSKRSIHRDKGVIE